MATNISDILKATGMTEDQLAYQILTANNLPATKPEAVEEPKVEEDKPSMLKRLGLWIKENADADEKRNEAARAAIADSWNNWRDTHDPQWRVGLVNAIFGDSNALNSYYQQQNAAKEAEKNREFQAEQARLNRESQAAYNTMWKEIEAKQQHDQNLAAAKVEYAKLIKDYYNADEAEKVIINAQLNKMEAEYPELNPDNYRKQIEGAREKDKAKAKAEATSESERKNDAVKEAGNLTTLASKAKTQDDKLAIANTVWDTTAYPKMNDSERQTIYNQIMGLQTIGEKNKAATEGAIASHTGKVAGEALTDKDTEKKIAEEIAKGRAADSAFLEAQGYNWDKHLQKWIK